MKTKLFFAFLVGLSQLVLAQISSPNTTTTASSQTTGPVTNTNPVRQSAATVSSSTIANATCNMCKLDSMGVQVNQNRNYFYYPKKADGWQTLLVFLPVLLFGVVLFVVIIWLRRSGFKLADMLSENEPSVIDVDNPDLDARKTIPFVKKSVLPRSTSRLVALLSGLCTVAIASCATSYYFYIYLKTGHAPDLGNLFDILLALGLGVVPYAVNKISTALK